MAESATEFESKLIPILRDGVEVVKMVCFRQLGEAMAERYPEREPKFGAMLAGAVINKIFGSSNQREPFASFAADNRELIDAEVRGLASHGPDPRIPLTDALRMQALCDKMDGVNDERPLLMAKEAGILIEERELPLPPGFLDMVRRIGKAYGLVTPPLPDEKAS